MVSSRLEMRGISLAFSGFQALSRVDFTRLSFSPRRWLSSARSCSI